MSVSRRFYTMTEERREQIASVNARRVRRLRCVDTGEEFDSMSEAAESIGVSISALSHSIKRGHKCKGRRWEYLPGPGAGDNGIDSIPPGA